MPKIKHQKPSLPDIADKLAEGRELNETERIMAASLIRSEVERRSKAGRPREAVVKPKSLAQRRWREKKGAKK